MLDPPDFKFSKKKQTKIALLTLTRSRPLLAVTRRGITQSVTGFSLSVKKSHNPLSLLLRKTCSQFHIICCHVVQLGIKAAKRKRIHTNFEILPLILCKNNLCPMCSLWNVHRQIEGVTVTDLALWLDRLIDLAGQWFKNLNIFSCCPFP